jgi:hypothetical protein
MGLCLQLKITMSPFACSQSTKSRTSCLQAFSAASFTMSWIFFSSCLAVEPQRQALAGSCALLSCRLAGENQMAVMGTDASDRMN